MRYIKPNISWLSYHRVLILYLPNYLHTIFLSLSSIPVFLPSYPCSASVRPNTLPRCQFLSLPLAQCGADVARWVGRYTRLGPHLYIYTESTDKNKQLANLCIQALRRSRRRGYPRSIMGDCRSGWGGGRGAAPTTVPAYLYPYQSCEHLLTKHTHTLTQPQYALQPCVQPNLVTDVNMDPPRPNPTPPPSSNPGCPKMLTGRRKQAKPQRTPGKIRFISFSGSVLRQLITELRIVTEIP